MAAHSAAWLLLALTSVGAKEWYVAATAAPGGEGSAAAPWASVQQAIEAAGPGDTIHLAPGLYRQQAVFAGRSGEPGRPLTLDGHGATLTGCDLVDPAAVEPAGPGRWRFAAATMPELLILDGRAAKQGRVQGHRGKPETLPEPAALTVGQWTWRDGWCQARNDREQPPAVEICVRDAGVRISGITNHLVIRNLACRHHWNDGFNIHGRCRDLRFESIVGYENQDEGFSAHEWCETDVRDAEFWGNENGVADVNRCQTVYHNVRCHDNLGFGFLFPGGRHWVHDSRSDRDRSAVRVSPGEPIEDNDGSDDLLATGDCVFSHFVATAPPDQPTVSTITGRAAFLHTTFVNVRPVVVGGQVRLEWSVLAGEATTLRLEENAAAAGCTRLVKCLIEPGPLRFGPRTYGPADWPALVAEQAVRDCVQAAAQLDPTGRPAGGSPAYQLRSGPRYYGAWPSPGP